MRPFEDIDNIMVPDLGMIQLMGGVFGNTWNKPFTQFPDVVSTTDDNKI